MFSYEQIKELINIIADKNLGKFEFTDEKGNVLKIKGKKDIVQISQNAPVAVAPSASAQVQQTDETESQPDESKEIKSPIVGTFYAASDPKAEPFVKVGDTIKNGDVIGIIEAMKIMNEIKADKDGIIKEILVSNGEVVEFDEPLIVLE